LPISQKQKPSWEKRGSSRALPPSPPRGNKGAWEPKNHEGAGRAPGLLLCYIGILGSDTEILYIMQKKALRAYSTGGVLAVQHFFNVPTDKTRDKMDEQPVENGRNGSTDPPPRTPAKLTRTFRSHSDHLFSKYIPLTYMGTKIRRK